MAEEYVTAAHHLNAEFSRADYEESIEPALAVTVSCIRQAMSAAGVSAGEIDKIMLVGGATRTPAVHALIANELGQTPRHEIDPDLIVAMGAAIQGAALSGQPAPAILIDITAHSYSIAALVDEEGLVCSPIIPRGTPLPVRRSESYSTHYDEQTEVRIDVYQGEESYPEDNTHLGGMLVEGLSRQPAGSVVVVEFRLDLNGILTATAVEKITGLSKAVTLDTRGQHRLNLDAARANLAALFAEADDEAAEADGRFFTEEATDVDDAETEEKDTAAAPGAGELLAAEKSLRRRAEAALATGLSPKDTSDIEALLETFTAAIEAQDWPALETASDKLSDLLFYLED